MIKSVGTLMRKSEDGFWKAFLSFYFIFYHVTHRSQTEAVMFVGKCLYVQLTSTPPPAAQLFFP